MLPSKNNLEIIEKTISQFGIQCGSKKPKGVIFGCTLYAGDIIRILKKNSIEVVAFIDNDNSKVGSLCSGIMVFEPSWVTTVDGVVVIIASPNYGREMKGQILGLGLKMEQILEIPVKNPQEIEETNLDDQFSKQVLLMKRGLEKYNELISRDTDILVVFPYPGTGDIYLACGFLGVYLKKNDYRRPLLVVSKMACEKVARLFGYDQVVVVSQIDIDNMLLGWQMLGSVKVKIKPALFWGWNTKYYFRNYKSFPNVSFIDYFKYDVFDLDKKDEFQHPIKSSNKNLVSKLFANQKLIEARTIIIAPYAGSFISSISMETWENVVGLLKHKGYTVCTNCYGKEEPIRGSFPLKFGYEIAVEVLERAGGFIAVRSGLCDVVSSANVKMLIIYESNYLASDIEYFGIKKMGLSNHVTEIDYYDPKSFLEFIDDQY